MILELLVNQSAFMNEVNAVEPLVPKKNDIVVMIGSQWHCLNRYPEVCSNKYKSIFENSIKWRSNHYTNIRESTANLVQ